MKAFYAIFTAVILTLFAAPSSRAGLIILGNLPQANHNYSVLIDAGTDAAATNFIHVRGAVSFTIPPQSFPVQDVALHLRLYDTMAGDVAAVGFYEDNGADLPGALVGSLFVSPPSNSKISDSLSLYRHHR
jgi:hypothetical protein